MLALQSLAPLDTAAGTPRFRNGWTDGVSCASRLRLANAASEACASPPAGLGVASVMPARKDRSASAEAVGCRPSLVSVASGVPSTRKEHPARKEHAVAPLSSPAGVTITPSRAAAWIRHAR